MEFYTLREDPGILHPPACIEIKWNRAFYCSGATKGKKEPLPRAKSFSLVLSHKVLIVQSITFFQHKYTQPVLMFNFYSFSLEFSNAFAL